MTLNTEKHGSIYMARKKIDIDWKTLDGIFSIGGTMTMASSILDISHDTIERRIKEEKGVDFKTYKESKLDKTRVRLQQKAIDMALNKDNVTLLIFCLKNLCSWTDKLPENVEDGNVVVNVKSLKAVKSAN